MWTLYQLALAAVLMLSAPWLFLRRGRHYRQTLSGRWSRGTASGKPHDVWIHAVSVGEVGVAKTLIDSLPADLRILLTTVTPTGQATANKSLGERATIAYLPIDLGPPIERFLDRYQPGIAIFIEGEFWPLLLHRLEKREIPRVLVNGRISDRSFPRLQRIGSIAHRLFFKRIDTFGVQTNQDRDRLVALGASSDRVFVTGNLKYETPAPPPQRALEHLIRHLAGGRQVLVAGSTMPREEEQVVEAYSAAGGAEHCFLVLAPRHPERFDPIATLLADRLETVIRRSTLDLDQPESNGGLPSAPDGMLLDSLGELSALYAVADACFIGGTLVPTGGHNPLEAARYGKPIAVGPSMHNFREMAQQFDDANAWSRVADAEALGATWRTWRDQPHEAEGIGRSALDLIESHRGAVAATSELLLPFFESDRAEDTGARS